MSFFFVALPALMPAVRPTTMMRPRSRAAATAVCTGSEPREAAAMYTASKPWRMFHARRDFALVSERLGGPD